MMICCGMAGKRCDCEEDDGTDSDDGDRDTDWYRYIESDMCCILSV
jgi:hypothetical protein